ncbi:Ribosomal protein L13 [Trinorchestia longiramus]|nr:Ribosomal protein L13 [Trinorchestia longiramus]
MEAVKGGFKKKPIIIDGAGHLKGRLAAFVAKQLLLGQRIIVVRCDQIVCSGPYYRNQHIFLAYLRKRCNVNPKRGPFHFRSPAKMFYKCVRGMVPWKTQRGRKAMCMLHTYEGVPSSLSPYRKMVVPEVMRVVRSNPAAKFCYLGKVAHEVGWKYRSVVRRLERRRLIKKRIGIVHKKHVAAFKNKAVRSVRKELKPFQIIKANYGY